MNINFEIRKILIILLIAICGHVIALIVKGIHRRIIKKTHNRRKTKWLSLSSLALSILVFMIYFIAFGQILNEFNISLTTYFASASIIGLAVAFGSQGIVQDVVTGVTLVFSDLLDIGDLVEIGGQTGYVENIAMRFVTIQNANQANIYIPNRSISNVINYSKGNIHYFVDVRVPQKNDQIQMIHKIISEMVANYETLYPSYFIAKTTIENTEYSKDEKQLIRIIFKLWPSRYGLIEGNFKQELLSRIKEQEPSFMDWMLSCAAEISKK
jgi:small conductance mechanosensitive channel